MDSTNDINEMKTIEIKRKNGDVYQCFVDDEDFERVSKLAWHIKKIGNNIYAEHRQWQPKIKKSKTILMHWFIMNSCGKMIDHKDCNGLNNQKSNLRFCNKSQNAMNTNIGRGKSRFKGVSKAQSHGIIYNDWYACIHKNYKKYHIGQFKTEIEAALAYNKKAIELFGEFANLNKI